MWTKRAAMGVSAGLALVVAAACGGAARQPAPGAGPGAGDATGAVASVSDGQEPGGGDHQSIAEYLRGRVPGLQIVPTPDGGLTVRIRGGGAQEPLVVIDGVPVQPATLGRVLSALNPDDIARVEVLKDVASTAVYGARGAYGVLLITTRKRRDG